jgi:hypothetical protein
VQLGMSGRSLVDAPSWCLDKLGEGLPPIQIRDRIRVGDQENLLTAAGIYLLRGHV